MVGPLALHAEQAVAEIEDQVVAFAFDHRPAHDDPELHRGVRDRHLR